MTIIPFNTPILKLLVAIPLLIREKDISRLEMKYYILNFSNLLLISVISFINMLAVFLSDQKLRIIFNIMF